MDPDWVDIFPIKKWEYSIATLVYQSVLKTVEGTLPKKNQPQKMGKKVDPLTKHHLMHQFFDWKSLIVFFSVIIFGGSKGRISRE